MTDDELTDAWEAGAVFPGGVSHLEHLRIAWVLIVAAYDWQSLALGRETALLGSAGHAFTADWSLARHGAELLA